MSRLRDRPEFSVVVGPPPYDGGMSLDAPSSATPLVVAPEQLAHLRYNADGLVPAIIQEQGTGTVLMMGWMNAETLAETLETGRTVFWSRSRQERWRKGDTSGDRQWVREAYFDCDGDTLLFVVAQEGRGACHTGEKSCFYRGFSPADAAARPQGAAGAAAQAPR
jgi:phosphoribosyl-AMP cyclohydrolase